MVRNSWKKGAVNPGYIWVSYEEQSFLVNTNNFGVITGLKKSSDREYMLSYDYHPLKANSNAADVDRDGMVTIDDATAIQKALTNK